MVSALAFSAGGHGFDPCSRRENMSATEHAFLSVICRDDAKCAVLRIGMLTGGSMCMESHPICRLKNPTVAFILQNRCVQCTPAHYPREILLIGTLPRVPLYRESRPLCTESHPLCRLKTPTVVYMTACRLSFCKTGVYNVRLLIIRERGYSSMYRKEERFDKWYAKELLLVLKAILVFT